MRSYLQNLKPLLLEKKLDGELVDKLIAQCVACLTAYEKII